MVRAHYKKVLLVAPDVIPHQLNTNLKNLKHISNLNYVFPSIFDYNPEIIIFDYDFTGSDFEKIIRRIKFNRFYQNLKIYCYKNHMDTKTESLLKVLGVEQLIYNKDLSKQLKKKSFINYLGGFLDFTIFKKMSNLSVK